MMLGAGMEKESAELKEVSPDSSDTSTSKSNGWYEKYCSQDETLFSISIIGLRKIEICQVSFVVAGLGGGFNHAKSFILWSTKR